MSEQLPSYELALDECAELAEVAAILKSGKTVYFKKMLTGGDFPFRFLWSEVSGEQRDHLDWSEVGRRSSFDVFDAFLRATSVRLTAVVGPLSWVMDDPFGSWEIECRMAVAAEIMPGK